jgi:hypothetical protein
MMISYMILQIYRDIVYDIIVLAFLPHVEGIYNKYEIIYDIMTSPKIIHNDHGLIIVT